MYNEDGVPEEKDLNLQMMSFMIVEFDTSVDSYVQYSTRMSLENAVRFCNSRREDYPCGDYKVHGELDF